MARRISILLCDIIAAQGATIDYDYTHVGIANGTQAVETYPDHTIWFVLPHLNIITSDVSPNTKCLFLAFSEGTEEIQLCNESACSDECSLSDHSADENIDAPANHSPCMTPSSRTETSSDTISSISPVSEPPDAHDLHEINRCMWTENAFAKIISNTADVLITRHNRVGKEIDASAEAVAECAHGGHINGTCEQCILNSLRRAPHRRQKDTVKIGSMAFDLLCHGHNSFVLIGTVKDQHGMAVVAYPLESKTTDEIQRAVAAALTDVGYLYNVPAITRIHVDGERGLLASKDDVRKRGIKVTAVTYDSAGNGLAERINGLIGDLCRRALSHITDPYSRQCLWPQAVRWAAWALSKPAADARALAGCPSRMSNQKLIPFGTQCISIIPRAIKPGKTEPRAQRGVYLFPHYDRPRSNAIALLNDDGTITGEQETDGPVRPCTDANGHHLLPNIKCVPTIARDNRITTTRKCRSCGCERLLKLGNARQLDKKGPFHCEMLQNVRCSEPTDGIQQCRRGPKRKHQLNMTDKTATVLSQTLQRPDAHVPDPFDCLPIPHIGSPEEEEMHASARANTRIKKGQQEMTEISDQPSNKADNMIQIDHIAETINDQLTTLVSELGGAAHDAHVTKLIDHRKAEHRHAATDASIAAELLGIQHIFDDPIEFDNVIKTAETDTAIRHTWSPSHIIVSIKHYEFLNKETLKRLIDQAEIEANARPRLDGGRNHVKQAISNQLNICAQIQARCKVMRELAQEVYVGEQDYIESDDANVDGIFEKTESKGASSNAPKYKGRFVVDGHLVKEVLTKNLCFGRRVDDAPDLWAPVTSLAGSRLTFMHSFLREGYELKSVDLDRAYIQTPWNIELDGRHYIEIPPDVRKLFSKIELTGTGMKKPMYRLRSYLYGHPLSGLRFIESVIASIKKRGWKAIASNSAVFQKDGAMLCIYVDDLCLSATPDGHDKFWSELAEDGFSFGQPYRCDRFLGGNLKFGSDDNYKYFQINMAEYVDNIVQQYLDEVGPLTNASAPATRDIRRKMVSAGKNFGTRKTKQQIKTIQSVLGKILWLHRVARADVGAALSFLCSRIATWDTSCDYQMKILVSYLKDTRTKGLSWYRPHDISLSELHACTYYDADHHSPRSQTGWTLQIQSADGRVALLLDWRSIKQKCSSDSTGLSEIIACHTAIQDTFSSNDDVINFVLSPTRALTHLPLYDKCSGWYRGDNLVPLRVMRRGTSPFASWHKASSLKVDSLKGLQDGGLLVVGHVQSSENVSDGLTKVLTAHTFKKWREAIGIAISPKSTAAYHQSCRPLSLRNTNFW